MSYKQLSQESLSQFNTEFVTEDMFRVITKHLDQLGQYNSKIELADFGGGNGVFVDHILNRCNHLNRCVVIDNSEFLLSNNQIHPKKEILCESIIDLNEKCGIYDVITLNFVLHHIVGSSYKENLSLIYRVLENCWRHLKPNGLLIVSENFYQGLCGKNTSSHIVWLISSNKLLSSFIKKFGVNTAGVGVHFNSHKNWEVLIEDKGFALIDKHLEIKKMGRFRLIKKIFLLASEFKQGTLVFKKEERI